jgi:hypothetical protein
MNVNNHFGPAWNLSRLDNYFDEACRYDSIRERIFEGGLNQLSEQERLFLLDFVTRREILHEAVKNEDESFVKALVEVKVDINARDAEGRSPLSYAKKPQMFEWLLQHGAKFEHSPDISMLKYVMSQSTFLFMNGEARRWLNVLTDVINRSTLEELCALNSNEIRTLADLVKSDPAIAKVLRPAALKIAMEKPQEVLKIAKSILGHSARHEYLNGFLYLIKEGVAKDPRIEEIMTNAKILFWNAKCNKFFNSLNDCWQPMGDLLVLTKLCNDFRLGIFCYGVLQTKTLEKASFLYSRLCDFPKSMESLDGEVKRRLVEHVQTLQKKEGSTIWHAMVNKNFTFNELLQMKHIGFDLNWTESNHNRNFLFTDKAWYIGRKEYEQMPFDLDHVDSNGDNALEYHCRHSFKANDSIKTLLGLGLRFSGRFPNIAKCREVFPGDLYLQSILASALLNPRRNVLKNLLWGVVKSKQKIFFKIIDQDPELREILGRNQSDRDRRRFIAKEKQNEQWREKFHSEDLKALGRCFGKDFALEDSEIIDSVVCLSSFWKGRISSEEFNLIPESPLVSLIIGAIKRQHQNMASGAKPIPVYELFNRFLSHDDMVFFNKHIFEHPEIMKQLLETYMKVQRVSIKPIGESIAKHAKFVGHLILELEDMLHLPESAFGLPAWQQTLMDTFNKCTSPIVKETLNIPSDAQVRWLGRTAIVSKKEGCEAFKFLKKGEKYDYFSQEHSVSMAFNDLADLDNRFKSQFIRPIGIYAVKQLPSALASYKQQLAEDRPAIVYHYKAVPETFEYLQDLPREKYAAARSRSLHDAARMIRMGIYPDLAAMFHNNKEGRKYLLLVDLMIYFQGQFNIFTFVPPQGAGRLDQPFTRTRFPNMRASGLTDLRDASLLYGMENSLSHQVKDMDGLHDISKGATRYFHQMCALSNVLLVDMLIQSQRYMDAKCLQWQEDALMQQFGNELAEGFAHVTASYSEQSYEKSLHFALQCGINWTRASRQIAFWLDTGPSGYPAWAVQGKIPLGLYEEGVEVTVDVSKVENFDPVRGFASNGNQDIGAYNGPLALTEFEKAMYLLFNAIALAEPLMSLPKPQVQNDMDWEWNKGDVYD